MEGTAYPIQAPEAIAQNHRLIPDFRLLTLTYLDQTEFQFWERNALCVDLFSEEVYNQKLNYIHYNPVEAGICALPEDYQYSSARFYETLIDEFGFLTHWRE